MQTAVPRAVTEGAGHLSCGSSQGSSVPGGIRMEKQLLHRLAAAEKELLLAVLPRTPGKYIPWRGTARAGAQPLPLGVPAPAGGGCGQESLRAPPSILPA